MNQFSNDRHEEDLQDTKDRALVSRACDGNEKALAELFHRHRQRLRKMVSFRMDRQLQGRIDPSDVLQEAFLDLAKRLPEFAQQPRMSIFVWLRLVTMERLLALHRVHIQAMKRDARREVSLHFDPQGSDEASRLTTQLIDQLSSVDRSLIRDEERERLWQVIAAMESIDREVIVLRVLEELSNGETAEVLGLTKQTASRRFISAIQRLRSQVQDITGLSSFG